MFFSSARYMRLDSGDVTEQLLETIVLMGPVIVIIHNCRFLGWPEAMPKSSIEILMIRCSLPQKTAEKCPALRCLAELGVGDYHKSFSVIKVDQSYFGNR